MKKATLLFFFFSSATFLFAQQEATTKNGKKVLLYDDNTWEYANEVQQQPKTGRWVEVFRFTGNGQKKSMAFKLSGDQVKLKYNYEGDNGAGLMAVYVVPEGTDITVTGGSPELMLNKAPVTGETFFKKKPGMYYVDVSAAGDWDIIIEEHK